MSKISIVGVGSIRKADAVPFTSFSEFNARVGGGILFAFDEDRLLVCFSGIWTAWTCVWKVKEGEVSCQLYGFLTTELNAEVESIHPKAMPFILTTEEECVVWMRAPAARPWLCSGRCLTGH
jgi:putative SOS response-associated peptidase YedK